MSFAARAAQKPTPLPCPVGVYLEQMPDEEARALNAMLADVEAWSHTALAQAMGAEGYPVHRDTVSQHRRHVCRCA